MSMINSEKTRKYSELHPVQIIENDAIFAVSQPDMAQTLESKKVTFKQIKEQLDYDLNVVEIIETQPPVDLDLKYILIGGYKVPAYKYINDSAVSIPTNVPRMVPVISGFLASGGITYNVPFTAINMQLSELTIESDTDYFSVLKVEKINDEKGVVTLISDKTISGNVFSIVTIKDKETGIYLSLKIQHAYIVGGLDYVSHKISNNIITSVWRGTFRSYTLHGNLQPSISILEDIDHITTVGLNYFKQHKCARYSEYSGYLNDMVVTTILNQSYTGPLTIQVNDAIQGLSASKTIEVNYKD